MNDRGQTSPVTDTIEYQAIQVVVRIRPSNNGGNNNSGGNHGKNNDTPPASSKVSKFIDSQQQDVSFVYTHNSIQCSSSLTGTTTYQFSAVYGAETTQAQLFNSEMKTYLSNLKRGVNQSVFCYGITGAGKTFTMTGDFQTENSKNRGIIPRTVQYLLGQYGQRHSMQVSICELYNEKLFDLLRTDGSKSAANDLPIREDQSGMIVVPGLTLKPVGSLQQFSQLYKMASNRRSTAPTLLNKESSRSHSILTIYLSDLCKIHLIDLAGSEDNRQTGNTGKQLLESVNINKSLFQLRKVVDSLHNNSSVAAAATSAAGSGKQKQMHVSYRDSKLTRLLQDSLGGTSKTILIANISEDKECFVQTCKTLQFAAKTKTIVNRVAPTMQEIALPAPSATARPVTDNNNRNRTPTTTNQTHALSRPSKSAPAPIVVYQQTAPVIQTIGAEFIERLERLENVFKEKVNNNSTTSANKTNTNTNSYDNNNTNNSKNRNEISTSKPIKITPSSTVVEPVLAIPRSKRATTAKKQSKKRGFSVYVDEDTDDNDGSDSSGGSGYDDDKKDGDYIDVDDEENGGVHDKENMHPNKRKRTNPTMKQTTGTATSDTSEPVVKKPNLAMPAALNMQQSRVTQQQSSAAHLLSPRSKHKEAKTLLKKGNTYLGERNFQKAYYYYNQASLLIPDNEKLLEKVDQIRRKARLYTDEEILIKFINECKPGSIFDLNGVGAKKGQRLLDLRASGSIQSLPDLCTSGLWSEKNIGQFISSNIEICKQELNL